MGKEKTVVPDMGSLQQKMLNKVWLNPSCQKQFSGEHVEISGMVYAIGYSNDVAESEASTNLKKNDKAKLSTFREKDVTVLQSMQLSLTLSGKRRAVTLAPDALLAQLFSNCTGQYFTAKQEFALIIGEIALVCTVKEIEGSLTSQLAMDAATLRSDRGMLVPATAVTLKSESSELLISGPGIFKENRKLTEFVGGLGPQVETMWTRAFAIRSLPLEVRQSLEVGPPRGILLYGPPGTGKTLIARHLGLMLNGKEPKRVNGPEVLSKFVGEAARAIRDLFSEAEKEWKERQWESDLHVIIFDEIDAICKQRGSRNDGTGSTDDVVTQLLSKMDGVDSLNNILVIGMTNRKDMLDDALLRPGRFEVHIEIGLPSEEGRAEILDIRLRSIKKNGYLEKDIDLASLARRTKNFSGADIEGLIRLALAQATRRIQDPQNPSQLLPGSQLLITSADFNYALSLMKPAYGASEDDFVGLAQNGIIVWNSEMSSLIDECRNQIAQVRNSKRTNLLSVLLMGLPGTGKSSLASRLALESGFPFVRGISPRALLGWSEQAKVLKLVKVFEDAYKSAFSMIVLDDLERLIDYSPLGPRYSNMLLQVICFLIFYHQAIQTLIASPPPTDCKLFVIATATDRTFLEDLGLLQSFGSVQVSTQSSFFQSIPMVPPQDQPAILKALGEAGGSPIDGNQPIPIKVLINKLEYRKHRLTEQE